MIADEKRRREGEERRKGLESNPLISLLRKE